MIHPSPDTRLLVPVTGDGPCVLHAGPRERLRVAATPSELLSDPELRAELVRRGLAAEPAPTPVVAGRGRLAAALLAAGVAREAQGDPIDDAARSGAALVSVADGPAPAIWDDLEDRVRAARLDWQRAWIEGTTGFAGPVVRGGTGPGHRDTSRRRAAAEPAPDAAEALAAAGWTPAPTLVLALAELVARSLAADTADGRGVLRVVTREGSVTGHRVLAWPEGIQREPIP